MLDESFVMRAEALYLVLGIWVVCLVCLLCQVVAAPVPGLRDLGGGLADACAVVGAELFELAPL
ncbi:hypothetical protein AMK24_31175 [Streptomyces sp. CB02366]|nr:hypothetical protein AMK24_31175 [Streptomyces sp. CB02366]